MSAEKADVPRGAPHCACDSKHQCALHFAIDRYGMTSEQACDWLFGSDDDETPSREGET